MWVLLGTVFVGSLLGSLHCVGMCGPFAMLAGSPSQGDGSSKRVRNGRHSPMVSAASYSLGRLTSYTVVGFVFGSLGMALNQGTGFAPFQQTATYVAGGLMIVVGSIALARQLGWNFQFPGIGGVLQQLLQRHFQSITQQPPLRRAFLIGAFSCLMPCGWLYTFAIVAAGTGSPLWGSVVMAVFWSGTVPIMVALMLGLNRLGRSIQQRIPVAMAGIVILIGAFTIAFRAPVAIGNDIDVVDQTDELISRINDVDQSQLPCCQDD